MINDLIVTCRKDKTTQRIVIADIEVIANEVTGAGDTCGRIDMALLNKAMERINNYMGNRPEWETKLATLALVFQPEDYDTGILNGEYLHPILSEVEWIGEEFDPVY